MRGALLAIGLGAAAIALPSTGSAQELPACPSDKTMDARVTSQERGEERPIVATHEVQLEADVADRTSPVSTSPDHVAVTPEAGVQVLRQGSGVVSIFAPAASTLTVVVTWRQSTDPSNFDETGRCSGSKTITLPVLSAKPARGAKQPNPGPDTGDYTFAIAAAEAKRADLRPLVVSVRSTGHLRPPRAGERLRTWTIPMRDAEQVKYHKHLPNLAYATTAQKCRSWWVTCGPAFAEVAALRIADGPLRRGLVLPDLSGSNSILTPLAFTQPARWAAEVGILINARGGAHQKPFGWDVEVRQAGRLLAHVQRVGRCVEERRSVGIFHHCTIKRSRTVLR